LPPIVGKDGKAFEVRRGKDGATVAFDGDKPVGLSSNEFGTAGVWVEKPHQGQGIGSELLARFMRENPNMKIGQMTHAGERMSRAAYRKLTKSLERNGETFGMTGNPAMLAAGQNQDRGPPKMALELAKRLSDQEFYAKGGI
jgi:GNAT superfamily N-acetyltransferase